MKKIEGNHNLFYRNCEHAATWCKIGEWKSRQIKKLFSPTGWLEATSDVYQMSLLNWRNGKGKGKVWIYTFIQHTSFIIGLLCFIPLIFSRITDK